jgi:hypothetical protein
MFVPEHLRHDTGNSKVEIVLLKKKVVIVLLLSHREGEAMVHTCHRKYK